MLPLSVSINGFDQYILPQYYSNILVITMGDSANQAKTKCSHLLQKEGFRFISKILELYWGFRFCLFFHELSCNLQNAAICFIKDPRISNTNNLN